MSVVDSQVIAIWLPWLLILLSSIKPSVFNFKTKSRPVGIFRRFLLICFCKCQGMCVNYYCNVKSFALSFSSNVKTLEPLFYNNVKTCVQISYYSITISRLCVIFKNNVKTCVLFYYNFKTYVKSHVYLFLIYCQDPFVIFH